MREVLVPEEYTVYETHLCVQVALGWQDTAGFEFVRRGLTVGTESSFAGEGITHDGHRYRHADEITLRQLVSQVGQEATYTYDYAKLWGARVRLVAKQESDDELPTCLRAEGAAPPETLSEKEGFGILLDALADEGHELRALAEAELGFDYSVVPPPPDLITDALRELFAEGVEPVGDDEDADDGEWGWWDPSKYDDAMRLRVLQQEMNESLSREVKGGSAAERQAALLQVLREGRS